jgi:hypothetical protein
LAFTDDVTGLKERRDKKKNPVDENDAMKGGWAVLYYGVLSKVINDNNFKKVAEVGIGYGTHAKYLLKTTNLDRLYLIDPTRYYPNDGFATDIMNCKPEIPNNNFNELCDLIKNELNPWKDRYTWFRVGSLDVTTDQIPDSSLDCVFIDGDHSYDAVKNDFETWSQFVSEDGVILLHDTCVETINGNEYGVKQFFEEIDLPKCTFTHTFGLGVISKNQKLIDLIQNNFDLSKPL